jgi:hypothetical protein
MNIGKTIKIITRPDVIPIEWPRRKRRKKDQPQPLGIPVPNWPIKQPEPVEPERNQP